MREIQFRAKELTSGKWVYGWYVGHSDTVGYIHGDYVEEPTVWRIDPRTLGQWTGLFDKNGDRIYEGDIFHNPIHHKLYYIVDWDEEFGRYSVFDCDVGFYPEQITISGNIHGGGIG